MSKDPILRVTVFIVVVALLFLFSLFISTSYWIASNPLFFNLFLVLIILGFVTLVATNIKSLSGFKVRSLVR